MLNYYTYVNKTYMEIMLDSSSYKTHQNDVIPICNRSKRFHYRKRLRLLDHNRALLLVELSSSFHPTQSNVLSSERVPKDFSILAVSNPAANKIYLNF